MTDVALQFSFACRSTARRDVLICFLSANACALPASPRCVHSSPGIESISCERVLFDAQCCVTGAAFEHMLQLGDRSLLETVTRNVVVFSRMKPHQKGQVVELLGSKGLHLVIDGQQQHLPVSHPLDHLPIIL